MEGSDNQNYTLPSSFYDKYTQADENMQAKIKPILNQIQENRVTVKEIHTHYGVRFSEMLTSYRNRLEDLKDNYEALISELQTRQNLILTKSNELLEAYYNKNQPAEQSDQ